MIGGQVSICIPLHAANVWIIEIIIIPFFYEPSAINIKLAKSFCGAFASDFDRARFGVGVCVACHIVNIMQSAGIVYTFFSLKLC